MKADLPGVEKKDIKVNVDGDVLTISHEHAAKKDEAKEENGVKYHVSLLAPLMPPCQLSMPSRLRADTSHIYCLCVAHCDPCWQNALIG